MPFLIRPFRRFLRTSLSGFMALIVLLLLSSGTASAEWVEVGSTADITIYVNPDTIRRKGDLVKMWHLFDYKTAQTYRGNSFLSIKGQRQYDCADERDRILASTGFSDNMGKGNVAYIIHDEPKWTPVAPDSIAEGLWKVACGKE